MWNRVNGLLAACSTLLLVGSLSACDGTVTVTGAPTSTTPTPPADTVAPTITAFLIPATSSSLSVPVTLQASDTVGVSGFYLSDAAATPLVNASGWQVVAPVSYVFASAGVRTLYAWAKDAAGHVSAPRSASVTITLADTTAPTVTAFTIPSTATSLTVSVTSFTATDNVAVTGYCVTNTNSAAGCSWGSSAPANVTFSSSGSQTAYAWAMDAAGNISAPAPQTVTISLPSGTSGGPQLNFSDIDSGPATGNTDGVGSGAIVTIWGNNLGSTQGTSVIKVGDVQVTAIYYWKNANGALPGGPADLFTYHKMQEIAFAIPASAVSGANTISVTVDGVTSNTLPFNVRAGNIKFIKSGGADASGNGSWSSPLATLAYPFAGNYTTGTAGQVAEGDIYYTVGVGSTSGLKIGGNNPVRGTAANPISLIAYPNTRVALSGSPGWATVIYNYYYSNNSRDSRYVNLSKLSVTASNPTCVPANDPVNGLVTSLGNRVIGMEFTGPTVYSGYGGAITCSGGTTGNGTTCGGGKYYGIYIHNYGQDNGWAYNSNSNSWTSPPYTLSNGKCYGADLQGHSSVNTVDRFQHVYYISNRDVNSTPVAAYEIGWNLLLNNPILHGIHIYDMAPGGGWTGTLSVHHNVVINQRGNSIDVAYPDSSNMNVFDNVVVADGTTNGGRAFDMEEVGAANVYNNTVYGSKFISVIRPTTVDLRNNIFFDTIGGVGYVYDTPTTKSDNLFYSIGGTSLPSWYSPADGDLNLNPQFTNPASYDFSLQSSSPALNAGFNTSGTVSTDFLGHAWSAGTVSIGASGTP